MCVVCLCVYICVVYLCAYVCVSVGVMGMLGVFEKLFNY